MQHRYTYIINHYLMFIHICSCYANNEENQSDCSKSLSNSTDAILIDKVSLSSSDSHVVGSDLYLKPANKTCSVEDSCVKLDATHLHVVENFSSVVNIEIPIIIKKSEDDIKHETTDTSFTGNHTSDSGSHVIIANSLLENDMNTTKNIVKGDLNHQKGNSQDESTRENITSVPENLSKRKEMDSSGTTNNAWRFKVLLIFVACCIIGCYLIPFVDYAIQYEGDAEISNDYSNEENITSANVRTYVIKTKYVASCIIAIIHTYVCYDPI